MSISDVIPILHKITERLSAIEGKIAELSVSNGSSAPTGGAASGASSDVPRSIKAFDSYCTSQLDPFVAAATKLGGDAGKVGNLVKEAWSEMRIFLQKAAACKEPPQSAMGELLKGIGGKMKEISQCVNRNEWEKHTKTCSEGVQALSWLQVKPAPRDHVESFIGGSDYWANGIRKEYRTTNPDQIAFCDTFKALLVELMAYIKEYHTTGVAWNPKGVDISEFSGGSAAPTTSTTAAAPTTSTPTATTSSNAAAPPKQALFAALSKEGEVTAGLKKVTKEQQTWRAEYKGGEAAPAPAPVVPKKVTTSAANTPKGPPKLEFQGGANKWLVENQTDANGVVKITINDKKETVYILNCINATIDIEGKCKSIIVDSCKKTQVHFVSAFGTCEIVNSQRIQIHCKESVASVAIDKTDGINVFLPASSLKDTSIVASKSSEMNVSFPDENGDIIERPIPEQYVHRIQGKSVTAEVSDLYGH